MSRRQNNLCVVLCSAHVTETVRADVEVVVWVCECERWRVRAGLHGDLQVHGCVCVCGGGSLLSR
jgi:hypothetical protein